MTGATAKSVVMYVVDTDGSNQLSNRGIQLVDTPILQRTANNHMIRVTNVMHAANMLDAAEICREFLLEIFADAGSVLGATVGDCVKLVENDDNCVRRFQYPGFDEAARQRKCSALVAEKCTLRGAVSLMSTCPPRPGAMTIIQTRLSERRRASHARSPLCSYIERACICGFPPGSATNVGNISLAPIGKDCSGEKNSVPSLGGSL